MKPRGFVLRFWTKTKFFYISVTDVWCRILQGRGEAPKYLNYFFRFLKVWAVFGDNQRIFALFPGRCAFHGEVILWSTIIAEMTFRFSSSCPLGGDIYQHCSEWCYFKGQTFAVYAVKNIFAVIYFILCTTSAHEKNKITIKKKTKTKDPCWACVASLLCKHKVM